MKFTWKWSESFHGVICLLRLHAWSIEICILSPVSFWREPTALVSLSSKLHVPVLASLFHPNRKFSQTLNLQLKEKNQNHRITWITVCRLFETSQVEEETQEATMKLLILCLRNSVAIPRFCMKINVVFKVHTRRTMQKNSKHYYPLKNKENFQKESYKNSMNRYNLSMLWENLRRKGLVLFCTGPAMAIITI